MNEYVDLHCTAWNWLNSEDSLHIFMLSNLTISFLFSILSDKSENQNFLTFRFVHLNFSDGIIIQQEAASNGERGTAKGISNIFFGIFPTIFRSSFRRIPSPFLPSANNEKWFLVSDYFINHRRSETLPCSIRHRTEENEGNRCRSFAMIIDGKFWEFHEFFLFREIFQLT